MRTNRWMVAGGLATALALGAWAAQAAEGWTEYRSRPGPGSRMVIDGTANAIHPNWKVESKIIGGTVEVGPNFPTDPATAKPGKLDLKAKVTIRVRSLKSIEDDGSPYSTQMDNIMYGKLKMEDHPNIEYNLGTFTLKEVKPDGTYVCEAEGELKVAGVAKNITMPVEMTIPEANRIKFAGQVTVKMTDFNVEPVDISVGSIGIRTGDEVKLTFEWLVNKRS